MPHWALCLVYLSFLQNISYFLVFLCSFIIPFTDDSITFQKLLFLFLVIIDHQSMSYILRLLMTTVRGVCVHIKASWNNHSNCLSCFSCSRLSMHPVCKTWTPDIWDLADKSRLYCPRRFIMSRKRLAKKEESCSFGLVR